MMHKLVISCVLIILNSSPVLFAQQDSIVPKKAPIYSVNEISSTLTDCNCFIKGIRSPLSTEEQKMVTCYAQLRRLDYRVLDSLYQAGNEVMKLYTFGILTELYPDSLKPTHLELLNNKHKISIYQRTPGQFPDERIGEIANYMYSQIEIRAAEKRMAVVVEQKILEFITTYALYPNSYKSISFNDYHQYDIDLGNGQRSEVYAVDHRYELKTIDGVVKEVCHAFKMHSTFVMMVIEDTEGNSTVSCFPPKLDYWLNQFGRPLTEVDRQNLELDKVNEIPLRGRQKRQVKRWLRKLS